MASEKRLIDTETVIRKLRKANCAECDNYNAVRCRACWVDDVVSLLEDSPTVDAVEVVRCKDCKWYQIRKWDDQTPKYDCRKTHALLDVKPDDFCSYGERREGE